MDIEDIKARILKAEEAVKKVEGTIKRHEARLLKLEAKLEKAAAGDENEKFWAAAEVKWCKRDIEDNHKKLEEKKQAVEKWVAKYEAAKAEQNALPECLVEFKDKLVEAWDAFDKFYVKHVKAAREEYVEWYRENPTARWGQKELKKKELGCTDSQVDYYLRKTQNDRHKCNEEKAMALIKNLIVRVEKKCGEITSWDGLYVTAGNQFEGAVINGTVQGTKGVARVESIKAGGYNIQKLHVRTLVK